ncbi:hypothetical protein QBC39DRAFT_427957 [Podospora conica]|nr:hypothetical protein QBC39DRAFT_427957 [Schizothecium conicum]
MAQSVPSSAAPMIMSAPMGLSPSPHSLSHPRSPWDQRSASPDRKSESRTLQGPSPKEWAAHRDTIIDLYRQFPLKKVSDLMRKHHNFSASKRMYDKRFREWNVFKNVNSDEKDRSVRRAAGARARSAATSPLIDRDSISQEDLRKSIRAAQAIPEGMGRASPEAPTYHPIAVGSASHPAPPSESGRRVLGIADMVEDPTRPGPRYPVATSEASSPHAMSSPSDMGYPTPSSTTEETPSSPLQVTSQSPPASPLPNITTFEAQIRALSRVLPPPIPSDPRSHSIAVISQSLRNFYDWQFENVPPGVLPDDYISRPSESSNRYWDTIKNGLYMVKISAGSMEDLEQRPDRRAWPAFAEAGRSASAAMTSQPFDFLRNVFAVLSPANTSARPELRPILLQFLASEARDTLSPTHPVTVICQELLRNDDDDNSQQEVSRRGLQCMLDIFSNRLGRSRAVSFKLLDSLATLLRRNGEFEAAMDIVLELLKSCRTVFGPHSDQARTVQNELAHFYMVADRYDVAMEHCMAVVTRPAEEGAGFYQDGIAAHTMEDIAEIHQRRGDVDGCLVWLERAAGIAVSVWGPTAVATGHIVDKMTSMQRRCGKDLLRSAQMWEAVIAQPPSQPPTAGAAAEGSEEK